MPKQYTKNTAKNALQGETTVRAKVEIGYLRAVSIKRCYREYWMVDL